MTDFTAGAEIQNKMADDIQSVPMAAQLIYKGSMCMLGATGFATKATATASSQFAGIATETVDNSAGAAGDKKIRLWRNGRHLLTFSDTLTQADNGSKVYATDTQVATVTTATNKQVVGVITEFVTASTAWVDITGATSDPTVGA